jgi:hypothetical protein
MKKTYFIFYTKNILNVLWSLIRTKLGHKYSEEEIPAGSYCYKAVESPSVINNWVYKTKKCTYYKTLPKGYNACKFLGVVTDDLTFDDQCKICDVKEDYPDMVQENREEKLKKLK